MLLFFIVIILALAFCGTPYGVMLAFAALLLFIINETESFEEAPDEATADTDSSTAIAVADKSYTPTRVAEIVQRTLSRGGDEEIYERMQHVAKGAEHSQMLNARRHAGTFRNLYKDELDATEARVWWEVDVLDQTY